MEQVTETWANWTILVLLVLSVHKMPFRFLGGLLPLTCRAVIGKLNLFCTHCLYSVARSEEGPHLAAHHAHGVTLGIGAGCIQRLLESPPSQVLT